MTLPIDFKTSLWLTWKPVWEWETVLVPGGGATEVDSGACASEDTPTAEERRLVFKGFELASSLYWCHADTPLARPWLTTQVDDDASRRQRALERAAEAAAVQPPAEGPPGPDDGSGDILR